MRVAFLSPVGQVGGAERVLLTLLDAWKAGEHAIVTEQHGLYLRRTGHAQNHHLRIRRHRLGRGGSLCARCEQRIQRLVACVFEHGQLVTMLDEVACNAMAHQANADHSNVFHQFFLNSLSPVRLPRPCGPRNDGSASQ